LFLSSRFGPKPLFCKPLFIFLFASTITSDCPSRRSLFRPIALFSFSLISWGFRSILLPPDRLYPIWTRSSLLQSMRELPPFFMATGTIPPPPFCLSASVTPLFCGESSSMNRFLSAAGFCLVVRFCFPPPPRCFRTFEPQTFPSPKFFEEHAFSVFLSIE